MATLDNASFDNNGSSTVSLGTDLGPLGNAISPAAQTSWDQAVAAAKLDVTIAAQQQPSAAASTQAPTHDERVQHAVTYFEGKGWTHEQAVGIVANLDAESGLDPSIHQHGGGPGYGLGQWEAPRQHDFQAWAHHDIQHSTSDEQLGFVHHELTGTLSPAGNALRHATTAEGAASTVTRLYERPRDIEGEAVRRANRATQIENQTAH